MSDNVKDSKVVVTCDAVELPVDAAGTRGVGVRIAIGDKVAVCSLEEAVQVRNLIDANISLARSHRDNILASRKAANDSVPVMDAEPVPNTADITRAFE